MRRGFLPASCSTRPSTALGRAVAAGWSDANQMETDRDLEALRSRDEFKKLVKDIQRLPASRDSSN